MARVSMITRTVTTTKAVIVYANIAESKMFEEEAILPRTYKSERDILKYINAHNNDENIKPIAVKSFTTEETLYGMSEGDFIAHAKALPPRTVKKETKA